MIHIGGTKIFKIFLCFFIEKVTNLLYDYTVHEMLENIIKLYYNNKMYCSKRSERRVCFIIQVIYET